MVLYIWRTLLQGVSSLLHVFVRRSRALHLSHAAAGTHANLVYEAASQTYLVYGTSCRSGTPTKFGTAMVCCQQQCLCAC